jgi:AcrR family transcriptional regulator
MDGLSPRAAATRQRILDAALAEFAEKGLAGARVDEIALRAGANKRMLYAYFGSKEELWLVVLEGAYAAKRAEERGLRVEALPPEEAMRRLVEFNLRYTAAHPEFVALLNQENIHRAAYLRRSEGVPRSTRRCSGRSARAGAGAGGRVPPGCDPCSSTSRSWRSGTSTSPTSTTLSTIWPLEPRRGGGRAGAHRRQVVPARALTR